MRRDNGTIDSEAQICTKIGGIVDGWFDDTESCRSCARGILRCIVPNLFAKKIMVYDGVTIS